MRNIDLDGTIRFILESGDGLDSVVALATDKLAAAGVEADKSKAVTAIPRHRRGPLKGQLRGSASYNMRGLLDWIDALPNKVEGQEPDAATVAELAKLVIIQATLANRVSG